MVNRLRFTGVPLAEVVVGYADRFAPKPLEMPLAEFLTSEVPQHRARYLRRGRDILWDRRPVPAEPAP